MKKFYKNHVKFESGTASGLLPHKLIAKALLKKFSLVDTPVMIAIGGPGGTGKTTFALKLAEGLEQAVILSLDDYKTPRAYRAGKNIYGPHPDANEMALVKQHLSVLKRGMPIEKPVYCRQAGRAHLYETFVPDRFVIIEGEIATYRDFYDNIDFSIFIDSHWKTQLNTRIVRDIEQRGYTPQKAIAAFLYSNLHEFNEYGMESKNWADVHIHCDQHYSMVIDAICSESAALMIEDVSTMLAARLSG
jgi:uridine kinase